MAWDTVAAEIRPHIVKIETTLGFGTGFIYHHNADNTTLCIATAAHVLDYSDRWQQPIRVWHPESQTSSEGSLLFGAADRAVFMDHVADSAVLIINNHFQHSIAPPQLLPQSDILPIGTEVGWLGFPSIEFDTLCFFRGAISGKTPWSNAYLIDGVSINGVSGGPVFCSLEKGGLRVVGIITAYKANRHSGESLPGLAVAQDVSHFHQVAHRVNSVDDARRRQQELQQFLDNLSKPPPQ